MQCLSSTNKVATPFWKELAESGDGKHLSMDNFSTIVDLIMAVVYREFAPDALVAYEKEVRAREPITNEMDHVFAKLRGAEGDDSAAAGTSGTTVTTTPAPRHTVAKGARKTRAPPTRKAAKTTTTTTTAARTANKNTRPQRATLNQRRKMVLRPKKYTPPAHLRMKLRSATTRGRAETTHCYLDNHNQVKTMGGHKDLNTPTKVNILITNLYCNRIIINGTI